MRRLLRFPPFTDLFRVTVSGLEETQALRACTLLRRSLEPWAEDRRRRGEPCDLLGPAPANVLKVNDRYRYRLLLKGRNDRETRSVLAQLFRTAQKDKVNKGLSILVDVNPMD